MNSLLSFRVTVLPLFFFPSCQIQEPAAMRTRTRQDTTRNTACGGPGRIDMSAAAVVSGLRAGVRGWGHETAMRNAAVFLGAKGFLLEYF